LQHEQPGFAQAAADAAFQNVLVAWLRFHEGMLIGEIIPELYRYLRNSPAAPDVRSMTTFLVDEYQDLNKAEQAVVDLLSTSAALCVVGAGTQ
jgi:DNA helicase II / ATP-dependent DNA helicase PcrA